MHVLESKSLHWQQNRVIALEWSGAILGMSGSLIMSVNQPWSKWAWAIWLVSNLLLLFYALMRRSYGLITMQVFFTGTSVLGFYRWIIA